MSEATATESTVRIVVVVGAGPAGLFAAFHRVPAHVDAGARFLLGGARGDATPGGDVDLAVERISDCGCRGPSCLRRQNPPVGQTVALEHVAMEAHRRTLRRCDAVRCGAECR